MVHTVSQEDKNYKDYRMRSEADGKTTSSFGEAVSSDLTGRTSATGLVGVLTSMLALVMIVMIVFYYFIHPSEAGNIVEFLDRAIIILGIGAGLLGCRKVAGIIGSKKHGAIIEYAENIGGQTRPSSGCNNVLNE